MISSNKIQSPLFFFFILLFSFFFFFGQIKQAQNKPLWVDEIFGLDSSVKNGTIANLLWRGAGGQGSPAPLDYILLKGLHHFRLHLKYAHLHPFSYYRLVANLAPIVGGVFAVGLFWFILRKNNALSPISLILLAYALMAFFLNPLVYYYAAEMRAYSLWNSLWLASLSLFFFPSKKFSGHVLVLSLLALTATASIFQLLALSLSFFGVQLFANKRWKETCRDTAFIFTIPLLISLFYCLKPGMMGFLGPEWGTWDQFLEFLWSNKLIPVVSGFAGAICFLRKETRPFAIPAVAVFILYCLGPLIFYVTRSKGFFFSVRQYIYYGVTYSVFFLTLARCFPFWQAPLNGKQRTFLYVGFFVFLGGFYFYHFRPKLLPAKMQFTKPLDFVVPNDPHKLLTALLNKELPRDFCLKSQTDYITTANFQMIAEWIPYFFTGVPAGDKTVFLETQGAQEEVIVVSGKSCQGISIPITAGATLQAPAQL